MRILVTRPVPEAERTATALNDLGHEALFAPMLSIEPVPGAVVSAGPWDAVLMTSGNAARALLVHPVRNRILSLPVFAVGRQTAAAARAAGFSSVVSADGDGADLARLVGMLLEKSGARLLYLAGSDRARDLGGDLAARGLHIETVVIYRADAATTLPDPVREALAQGAIDGVLHFSQRTASIFLHCAESSGSMDRVRALTHYCLSRRVSEPLASAGIENVRIAPHPDEPALLGLIVSA